jgi:hypothetical protein
VDAEGSSASWEGVERLIADRAFSRVVLVELEERALMRARLDMPIVPGPSEHARHPVRDRERDQGADGFGRDVPVADGTLGLDAGGQGSAGQGSSCRQKT